MLPDVRFLCDTCSLEAFAHVGRLDKIGRLVSISLVKDDRLDLLHFPLDLLHALISPLFYVVLHVFVSILIPGRV